MRSAVRFLVAVTLLSGAVFAGKRPEDYPLKFTILDLPGWSSNAQGVFSGTGRGNIADGESIHGVEFSYVCDFRLDRTAAGQAYRAKWAKPQFRLRILTEVIGEKDKYQECELKTTVRDEAYLMQGVTLTPIPQSDFKRMEAAGHPIADLADYTLSFRILEERMTSYSPDPALAVVRYRATGRGSLLEDGVTRGVSFTYMCSQRPFPFQTYRAKWVDPQKRLGVAVAGSAQPNQYYACEFEISM